MDPFTMEGNRSKTLWRPTGEMEEFSAIMLRANVVGTEGPVPDPVPEPVFLEENDPEEGMPLPFDHSVSSDPPDPLNDTRYTGEYYFSIGLDGDDSEPRDPPALSSLDLYADYANPVSQPCAYTPPRGGGGRATRNGHRTAVSGAQAVPTAPDSSSPAELLGNGCGDFVSTLSSPEIGLKEAGDSLSTVANNGNSSSIIDTDDDDDDDDVDGGGGGGEEEDNDSGGESEEEEEQQGGRRTGDPASRCKPSTTSGNGGGVPVGFPRLDFLMSPLESRVKSHKKSPAERAAKNQREQVRIREKNCALSDLKLAILSTNLLNGVAEQQRWTEKVTLDQAILIIHKLETSIMKATGKKPQTQKPFLSDTAKHKKKEPNVFLEFSEVMRSSFMETLKVAIFPPEFVRQKDTKVDNRYVTKLLSAVWNCLSPTDKHLKWRKLSDKEKQHFVEQARTIIRENMLLRK